VLFRSVRDYIAQAHAANSLPQLPQLIDQFQAQPELPLYIALFIEYYLQINAHGTIATQLPHASTLSDVARRIGSFKDSHDVDAILNFSSIGKELSIILGPLCQIIEPLCQRPITRLCLSDNRLTSLPAGLGNLTNLTVLDLWNNRLSSFPTWIGNLTNLTELDFSLNNLAEVPAALGKLTNLRELNLYNNQLTFVPASIGKLTNLTTLYLSYNKLRFIPAALDKLTNLTTLNLLANELTFVPPCLNRAGLVVEKDYGVEFEAE
jgi:Leucine-rich repeat (LRR) protein